MKAVLLGLALTALAGCSAQHTTINRLQFSGDTVSFPENYQTEAARVVTSRKGTLAEARVSRPRETLGASMFSPKRWYVCVQGLPAPNRPDRLPNAEDAISSWMGSPTSTFDILLFFSGNGRAPSVRSGFDSPLCRDVKFEPITTEAPT